MKAGRESDVKRMLEFELYDEVSEELTSGKRIVRSGEISTSRKPNQWCMPVR